MLKKYGNTNSILQKLLSNQIQQNQQQQKKQKVNQQSKEQQIKLNQVQLDQKNAISKQQTILMKLKQLKNKVLQSYIVIRNTIIDQRKKHRNQQIKQYKLKKKLKLLNQKNKILINEEPEVNGKQQLIKKTFMQKSSDTQNKQRGAMRIYISQKRLRSSVLQHVKQYIKKNQYTQKDGKKQFPQMYLSEVCQIPIKIKRKKQKNTKLGIKLGDQINLDNQ